MERKYYLFNTVLVYSCHSTDSLLKKYILHSFRKKELQNQNLSILQCIISYFWFKIKMY